MSSTTFASMPSTTAIFSLYTQCAAYFMIAKSMLNQVTSIIEEYIPDRLRTYIQSKLAYILTKLEGYFYAPHVSYFTINIHDQEGKYNNQVYYASQTYLRTLINPKANRLLVSKVKQKSISLWKTKDDPIIDNFQGIQIIWNQVKEKSDSSRNTKRRFELQFEKGYKEKVLASYLPYVLKKAQAIRQQDEVIELYGFARGKKWIDFDHPSTFDTLAMDPEVKKALMNDLDMFLERKDFYKKIGKAWRRGYLLYGPPGTGKSSLIAAMANYLKFDVVDLQLNCIRSETKLRNVLVETGNRSIIVIEDIDCGGRFKNRQGSTTSNASNNLTLSEMLNFIDGLWSSCCDERIIVFTTNHKDRLDPALLRPGRMDMHIHMSYCTPSAFKVLANNYLRIQDHPLFGQIEGLIEGLEVTPAEIAQELMKNNEADPALEGLVQFLLQKKIKKNAAKDEEAKKVEHSEENKQEEESEKKNK